MESDLLACRLCSNKKDLLDVGNESTQYAAEYRNIVKIMTGIKVYPNDPLLSWICRGCLKRAIENYEYRRNAIQRNLELARKQQEKQISTQLTHTVAPGTSKHKSLDDEPFTRSTDIANKSDSDVEMGPISFDITMNESLSDKINLSSPQNNNTSEEILLDKVVEQSTEAVEDTNNHDIKDNSSISSASTIKPCEKSNIADIIQEYPNLKLPQQAYELVFKELCVNLTHKAVKQHIVKLNRRTRRHPKKRKSQEPADTTSQRLDIPETMPTSPKVMKELITSSLGLQRIGPVSPLKPPTPQHTPSKANVPASPQSSFTLPQKTPKKSILHPAVINSPKKFKLSKLSSIDDEIPTVSDLIESINNTPSKEDTTITNVSVSGSELNLSQESRDSSTNPDYSLVKVSSEETAYICDYCYLVFGSKRAYVIHRKVHLRCRYCGATFPDRGTLNLHREKCLERPREIGVSLVRMESDPSVRNQIPQLFFDLIGGTVKTSTSPGQANPGDAIEREIDLRMELVDSAPSPITLSSPSSSASTEIIVLPKSAPDDSFFAQIQKECPQDGSIVLSDVESIHLVCKSEIDADIAFDERLTSLRATSEKYECLLMDEFFHGQRLLGEIGKKQVTGKVDASNLVRPKDFVTIENSEQTLCVKNLRKVLMTGDIIPVLSKVQKKHLKVKIIDAVPPKKDLIFYDCSKITPISLVSCRQMTNKRRSFHFVAVPAEVEKAQVPSTSSSDNVPKKKQKGKNKEKAKKERKICTANLIKIRISKDVPTLKEKGSSEVPYSNGTGPKTIANDSTEPSCSTSSEPVQNVAPASNISTVVGVHFKTISAAISTATTNPSSSLQPSKALSTVGTLLNKVPNSQSSETQISSLQSNLRRNFSVLKKSETNKNKPNNYAVSAQKPVFSASQMTKSNPVLLPAAVPTVDSYLSNLTKLSKDKPVSYINNTANESNATATLVVNPTNLKGDLISLTPNIGHPTHQIVRNPNINSTLSSSTITTSSFQPATARTPLNWQPSATTNSTSRQNVDKAQPNIFTLKSAIGNVRYNTQRKKTNPMSAATVGPSTTVANTTESNIITPKNLPSFVNPAAAVYKPLTTKGIKILTPSAINEKRSKQGYVRIDNNDIPTYVPLGSIIQKPNVIRYCFNQPKPTEQTPEVSQPTILNSYLPYASNSQSRVNNSYSSNSPLVLNHQLGSLGSYNTSSVLHRSAINNNTAGRPAGDDTLRRESGNPMQREPGEIQRQDLGMGITPKHNIVPSVQTPTTIHTPGICNSNNNLKLVVNNVGVTTDNYVQQDNTPPINFLLQK